MAVLQTQPNIIVVQNYEPYYLEGTMAVFKAIRLLRKQLWNDKSTMLLWIEDKRTGFKLDNIEINLYGYNYNRESITLDDWNDSSYSLPLNNIQKIVAYDEIDAECVEIETDTMKISVSFLFF